MRNIVVAYDGSDPARRALERAAELAGNGATLTVVSAVSVQHASGIGRTAGPVDPEEREERNEDLVEAGKLLSEHGMTADLVETVGDPPDAISDMARELGADLVAVGTRGRSAGKRIVLGSVSTSVLHHAHCDVLVVR